MTYKLPEPAYPLGRGDLPSFSDEQITTAYAAGLAARVPEGWKMAPIEPTDSMAVAAIVVALGTNAINGVEAYRAMLAAAPEPVCRYPDCKCPTETPCLQGLPEPKP